MEERNTPTDWGKDSLSGFIEDAYHNTLATFANLKPEFTQLKNINDAFKKITENLINTKELIPAFFLLRSHSSYLAAVRLAVSGQIPEAYMVLRGCLENSLYAFHIARVPEMGKIWLRRSDDGESLKQCKANFGIWKVFRTLELENVILCETARHLYEITIDYGGHPNEASLTSIMSKSGDDSQINFKVAYLTSYEVNPLAFRLCLKNTARMGVCSLMIFKLVFRERFDILGLSDNLQRLKQGL